MHLKTTIAVVAVLAVLAAGCAKEAAELGGPTVSQPGMERAALAADAPRPSARKLIRTVDLSLTVDDPTASAERVREMTDSAGGYVSNVNAYRVEGLLRYSMTIRIPVERLDDVVGELKRLAVTVEQERLRTEDVTAQFVDLEASLRTLRLTEKELQALLAESRARGSKAEEIMVIYGHLTEIRTRIERIQGQLNALDKLATFSTVNLQLTPTEAARPLTGDSWRPGETARGSLRTLMGALKGLTDLAIWVVIVVVPIGLALGFVLWLVSKGIRKIRRRSRGGK